MVIWYDAVTIEGKLKWQNGLTNLNLPFFEESNAIFTNYTFKEDHLKASQKISGDNSRKIYAGVDVFSRGTFGGGEMNTHLSISAADSFGQNSAIFAPGWLVEKQNFEKSGQFWTSVYKALKPDGNSCSDGNICQEINTKLTLDGDNIEFEIINARCLSDSKIEFEERFQIKHHKIYNGFHV